MRSTIRTTVNSNTCRPYGFSRLLLDGFLLLATGGLWVIWMIIREVRAG